MPWMSRRGCRSSIKCDAGKCGVAVGGVPAALSPGRFTLSTADFETAVNVECGCKPLRSPAAGRRAAAAAA